MNVRVPVLRVVVKRRCLCYHVFGVRGSLTQHGGVIGYLDASV